MWEETALEALKKDVEAKMSKKRFTHTSAVADMAVRLGRLYAPSKLPLLFAAGLLHDITKEYTVEQHLAVFEDFGIKPTRADILTPKTFHARTAALLIPRLYPEFADEELITAVRYHTTGREGMSMTERLVYFADYIDESRTFEDCVVLRRLFWEAYPERMGMRARAEHLRTLLVLSFDKTVSALIADGSIISEDTMRARNSLLEEEI